MREDWAEVDLANVAERIHYGFTAASENTSSSGAKYLRITDIQEGTVNWNNVPLCQITPAEIAKFQLQEGNLVFARTGGTVGKSYLIDASVPKKAVFASYLIRVIASPAISPKYLYAFFQSLNYWQQIELGKIGLKTNVNAQILGRIRIPLPPLSEQRTIVSRIEELFSAVDSGVDSLRQAQAQLKVYRQAVLKKAFEGELTKEWREANPNAPHAKELLLEIHKARATKKKDRKVIVDTEINPIPFDVPVEWKWTCLGNLTSKLSDGPFGSHLKGEDYISEGVRVVRLENIKNLEFDNSKQSFVSEEKYRTIERHTVYPDDIIFSTFIAETTKVVILPKLFEFAINKADCICMRPEQGVSNKYLQYYLSSQMARSLLIDEVHGATRPRVNTTQLKAMAIPACSTLEQHQIVQEIEKRLSVCDSLEVAITDSLSKAEALRQSILKKAFAGQLLTESALAACRKEKDWEPVGVLVERIKKEKLKKETV